MATRKLGEAGLKASLNHAMKEWEWKKKHIVASKDMIETLLGKLPPGQTATLSKRLQAIDKRIKRALDSPPGGGPNILT